MSKLSKTTNVHESRPFEPIHLEGDLMKKVPVDLKTVGDFDGPRHLRQHRETVIARASELMTLLSIKEQRDDSYIDSLTGLPDKNVLDQMVDRIVQHNKLSERPVPYVVAVLDVNSLKLVNDASRDKHQMGDRYLHSIAETIKELQYPGDFAARRSGDEFVVLMPATEDMPLAEDLQKIYSHNFHEMLNVDREIVSVLDDAGYKPGVSVGMALWDGSSNESFMDMFAEADRAMYDDKSETKRPS